MIQEERLTQILNLLKKKKKMSNEELSQSLFCSISTLRRDLIKLEEQQLIRRVHGGVVINIYSTNEPSFDYRETNYIKEKKYICDITKEFIGSGMCLFLDSSSTVHQLVPLLKNISNLVLLTNGIKVALTISEMHDESIKAFVFGGEIKKNSSSIVGTEFSEIFINQFNIDLAIISCRGLDENGVYESSLSQARIKQNVLSKVKNAILLVDESKFDSTHFFKVADINDFSAIVTNKQPSQKFMTLFQELDIDCLY